MEEVCRKIDAQEEEMRKIIDRTARIVGREERARKVCAALALGACVVMAIVSIRGRKTA